MKGIKQDETGEEKKSFFSKGIGLWDGIPPLYGQDERTGAVHPGEVKSLGTPGSGLSVSTRRL